MYSKPSGMTKTLITSICSECEFTRKQFADVLGYASVTSVDRLLQCKAGEKAIRDAVHRISNCQQISLSPANQELLGEIQTLLFGENYANWISLLLKDTQPKPVYTVYEDNRQIPLLSFLDMTHPQEILIFGEPPAIFLGILKPPFLTGYPVIRNYVIRPDSLRSSFSFLKNILPILFQPNFSSILVPGQSISSAMFYNVAHLKGTDNAGVETDRILLFLSDSSAVSLPCSSLDYEKAEISKCFQQIGILQFYNAELPKFGNDYLAYLDYCKSLESKTAIYRFKQDIGIEQVPFEIQSKAIHEGTFSKDPESKKGIAKMVSVQKKRYLQSLNNPNPQIHVFSDDMWDFIHTGRMSDHFWGLRPFTVNERLQIITDLIGRCVRSDNFEIRFLRDSKAFSKNEVICYEKDRNLLHP